MKKFWLLAAGLVVLSGSMFGDTIGTIGACGTCGLLAVPSTSTFVGTMAAYPVGSSYTNAQIPFWNNPSVDVLASQSGPTQHYTNVGDILSGYATGTNLIGGNYTGTAVSGGTAGQTTENINGTYYAVTGGSGDPTTSTTGSFSTLTQNGVVASSNVEATPTLEFSFQSQATAYSIALLFADSTNDTGCAAGSNCSASNIGTIFGVYTETATNSGNFTFTPITSPTDDLTGPTTIGTQTLAPNTNYYGFYATVCYAMSTTAGVSTCTASVTYTTGAGNFSSNPSGNAFLQGLGWNHFALFELANGEEVLGFEDSPWTPGSGTGPTPLGGEGIGDFNDIVVALTPPTTAPEPGTIAIMGLGLAGLGLLNRRRFAKK